MAIYCLIVEVITKAEVNEQKVFCTKLFKGSKEKQLIEINECRTLMKKFVINKENYDSKWGGSFL